MRFSRAISLLTVAAAAFLSAAGPASAHASGHTSASASGHASSRASTAKSSATPSYTTCVQPADYLSLVTNPVRDQIYKLVLPNGTFEAEWSSAWNLAMSYAKTGGSTIKYDFQAWAAVDNYDCVRMLSTSFSDLAVGQTGRYIFSGPAEPGYNVATNQFIYVYAVLDVPGQGYFEIEFD